MQRRTFIKSSLTAGAGLGMAFSPITAYSASPNNKLIVAAVGVRSRGKQLAKDFGTKKNVEIGYLCDVDSKVLDKKGKEVEEALGYRPRLEKDFRKALDDKDVDIVVIATPDHWHAPLAILALEAGKHVYVEKPCSHNPREGELLVKAQKKYGKLVQMGNQQRSGPTTIEAIQMIREGAIGTPYFGKAWYASGRGSIGIGKEVPVPDWLDYDLWQGPAPRRPYKDNVIHYCWHWFWHWGTGEILNNGTHEIDICRWALDAAYPTKVTSAGGRYCYEDDWEFYDTQSVSYEFGKDKLITWEGKSCNRMTYEGRGRGAAIHGTHGTMIIHRNGYELYDENVELIKKVEEEDKSQTLNRVGAGKLNHFHIQNFLNGIRNGEKLNSPIQDGNISVTICQLGNVAQKMGRTLNLNTENGHILNDAEAMNMWGRDYEPGWEPKV